MLAWAPAKARIWSGQAYTIMHYMSLCPVCVCAHAAAAGGVSDMLRAASVSGNVFPGMCLVVAQVSQATAMSTMLQSGR